MPLITVFVLRHKKFFLLGTLKRRTWVFAFEIIMHCAFASGWYKRLHLGEGGCNNVTLALGGLEIVDFSTIERNNAADRSSEHRGVILNLGVAFERCFGDQCS